MNHIIYKNLRHISWKHYLFPMFIAAVLYTIVIKDNLFGDEFAEYSFAVLGHSRFGMSTALDIHTQLARLGHLIIAKPWSIRLYSILCGLGTILFVGKYAHKFISNKVAVFAMWVAAFSPFLIEFAPEARPNAIFMFAGILFLYAFMSFVEDESLINTAFVIFAGCFGLLAREMFIVIIVFCFGYYIIKKRKVTIKLVITGLVMLPFIIRLYIRMKQYSNFAPKESAEAPVSLINFLFRLPVAFAFGYNTLQYPERGANFGVSISDTFAANLFTFICMILVFISLLIGFIILVKKDMKILLTAAAVLVPVGMLILAQELGFSILNVRHCAGVFGIYCVLIAAILIELYKYKWGKFIILLYVYLIAISLYHFYFQPEIYSRRSNYIALNRELENNLNNEDYIIVYHRGTNEEPDYLPALRKTDNIKDIYKDLPTDTDINEYVYDIDLKCKGRIFLIANSATKNWVDPDNSLMSALQKERTYKTIKYGRNLSLYIFNQSLEN